MQTHGLTNHPAHPPLGVTSVEARIGQADDGWLHLRWLVEGSAKLILPELAGAGRADDLWKATCFELFVRKEGGEAYSEFNFSPSEQWAAYDFTDYREGMNERAMERPPVITPRKGGNQLIFDVALRCDALPSGDLAINLTAVLEEEGGVKSYWAISHRQDKPDFHDASCFNGTLAAPDLP